METITIHEKVGCGWCLKAKELLNKYKYEYISEVYDPSKPGYEKCKEFLFEYSGKNSFPQIYLGNRHIGGYDDLLNAIKNGTFN